MTTAAPGPWTASNNGHYWQIDSERDGQIGDACASLYDGTGEPKNWKLCEANARLMAAAPDILAALTAILANHETVGAGASIFQCTSAEVKAARAAIAKASA